MNAVTLTKEDAEDSSLPQIAQQAVEQWSGLCQLEHSWRMIHEPLPEAEAEQLLKQVFPE